MSSNERHQIPSGEGWEEYFTEYFKWALKPLKNTSMLIIHYTQSLSQFGVHVPRHMHNTAAILYKWKNYTINNYAITLPNEKDAGNQHLYMRLRPRSMEFYASSKPNIVGIQSTDRIQMIYHRAYAHFCIRNTYTK